MVTVGDTAGLIQYVNEHAPEYGLDPAAVLSAARVEGWSGRIGDGGLAYGPWQDHMTEFTGRGPWYGAGRNSNTVNTWAWSSDGINQAMSEMVAAGVKGKTGLSALYAMVYGYERPQDKENEYKLVQDWYNSFNNGSAVGTTPPAAPPDPNVGEENVVASGLTLVAGAGAGTEGVPSLFGNTDLGKAVARVTSPGFWWAAGLFLLAGLLILIGLLIYFRKDVERVAGGALAAA